MICQSVVSACQAIASQFACKNIHIYNARKGKREINSSKLRKRHFKMPNGTLEDLGTRPSNFLSIGKPQINLVIYSLIRTFAPNIT